MNEVDLNEPQVAVEEPHRPPQEESESPIDWIEVFSTIWGSRKLIAYVVGATTLVAVVVSLLLPESFKSTTTILPETERSKLAALGGLSDLAALAGVSTGEASLAKLYPTIIKSEAVLKNVIYPQYQTKRFKEPVNLITFWGIEESTPEKSYETAVKKLRDELEVSLDNRTSVVTISLETREPALCADILNNVTKELDLFIRTKRTTNAGEQRRWIEARLAEVKRDLEKSENALKEFREKNRQVSSSPQLLLEQERLVREVQINATLYTELKKQYEIVKIEEIKNVPIINVLDAARAAASKENPKRRVVVLTSLFLSLMGVLGYVLIEHRYGDRITGLRSVLQDQNKISDGGSHPADG